MMLRSSRENLANLAVILVFYLAFSLVVMAQGIMTPVWRRLSSTAAAGSQAAGSGQPIPAHPGTAVWLDERTAQVWLYTGGPQPHVAANNTLFLWTLDLKTLAWTLVTPRKDPQPPPPVTPSPSPPPSLSPHPSNTSHSSPSPHPSPSPNPSPSPTPSPSSPPLPPSPPPPPSSPPPLLHPVLCGRQKAIILVGQATRNESFVNSLWMYNRERPKTSNKEKTKLNNREKTRKKNRERTRWHDITGKDSVFMNVTTFWCSSGDLFGYFQTGILSTLVRYSWEHGSWIRMPSQLAHQKLSFSVMPDVKDMSGYPRWPSKRGYIIMFAPALSLIDPQTGATSRGVCQLWFLDKDLRWRAMQDLSSRPTDEPPAAIVKNKLPSCRSYAGTWIDTSHNLWLYGGQDDSQHLHDTWMFDMKSRAWLKMGPSCEQPQQPGCEGSESGREMQGMLTWRWDRSLYILKESASSSTPLNVTFTYSLWAMDLKRYLGESSLAVRPLGLFLIILGISVVISLGACVLIILAKCTSPKAPRIKPPVRSYGRVLYSQVNTEEVP